MRRIVVAWMCAACGRLGFDASPGDASGDAPIDAPGACWTAWRSGAPRFGPATRILELALPDKQGNPWLAPDDRTLYFDSGTGDTEMFRATRPSRDAAFAAPQQLTELTSPQEDTGLILAGDERTAVFSSSRQGSQGFDLYLTLRPDPGSPFGVPDASKLGNLNSALNEVDPFLTSDALTMIFAQSSVSAQRLLIATRASVADAFGAPIQLPGTGTFQLEADADLSPDGLVLAFAAIDTAALQLYAAVRPSREAAFGPPFPLSDLASAGVDGDPAFSSDGCELFWISDRDGDRDLFHADVLP